ncbi:hypothetical protein O1611_g9160 [Lasiodiplodia mahajangana]|uniref:Uncharacterized protein n=1 Tax=Lasiodiplodia mahajangana TaxID=1108764 RepID=A0ACC2JAS1_9PEZI|nr:hypothetical protein O1611_g9160 [Lasiodiplodia mahajangana]
MVGIPRSKGCKTCRRKKVKCDEQKPRCGQCRKGVRECEGYDQPTIFRHSSVRDFAATSHSCDRKGIPPRNQPLESITWATDQRAPDKKNTVPRQERPNQRVHPYTVARAKRAQSQLARTVPLLRTPDSMVLAVQSITGQFLQLCLPLSETQEAPLAWLGDIKDMGQDIDALPLAMSALALGWAGHVDNQPHLADKGLQLYNAAIRQLRDDMNTYTPLQSLIVTTIFVAFELCQFGSKGNPGWLAHMKGIAAFLQALGPEKVSTDPYLKIYSFCRVVFIMQGLTRRRSVCASSHMWIHGPFRNHKKNAYHQFYDLSAEACGLLGCSDDLGQAEDGSQANEVKPKQAQQVLHDMLSLISRLKKWMQDSNIVGINGPLKFPNNDLVADHQLGYSRAHGYPIKLPPNSKFTSDTLYWQMMMYNYWALRLDLYMTILDNPVLSSLLKNSDDFQALVRAELEVRGPEGKKMVTTLIFEECRKLANNIAVNFPSECYDTCQSFGSLVTAYTLETTIRWYERHGGGASQMDAELEQHCRAILDGIRIEESRNPCPFEVSILPDEVLKQHWC